MYSKFKHQLERLRLTERYTTTNSGVFLFISAETLALLVTNKPSTHLRKANKVGWLLDVVEILFWLLPFSYIFAKLFPLITVIECDPKHYTDVLEPL